MNDTRERLRELAAAQRPLAVSLTATLFALHAADWVVRTVPGALSLPPARSLATLGVVAAVAALDAAIAVGLWRRSRWAWRAGMVVSLVAVATSIVQPPERIEFDHVVIPLGALVVLVLLGTARPWFLVGRGSRAEP